MSLTELDQIKTLLTAAKHVLVAFAPGADTDSVASALALQHILSGSGRYIDIVSDNFQAPKALGFLPRLNSIQQKIAGAQRFTIKVDVSRATIDTISYDIKDKWLAIHLTPTQGAITKNDLRTLSTGFKYDAIITINTPDLAALGAVFANNTDLFYRTPIVNIDHHSHNERYGHVNLVDVTATSAAEIIYRYIKTTNPTTINKTIATLLLTGVIAATKSFKAGDVTPQTLGVAGELIEQGGERETIIRHLYRTRTVATLKLWGEALRRLTRDSSTGLVATTILRTDFENSSASVDDLQGIIEDLISNSPEASMTLLLYEGSLEGGVATVHGVLVSDRVNVLEIVKSLEPTGEKHRARVLLKGKTIQQAQQEITELIRARLPERLKPAN